MIWKFYFCIKKINFIHFLTTFIKPDTQLNTLYSQEPRVLVVDPATVGLQENVQITNEDTKKISDIQRHMVCHTEVSKEHVSFIF